MASFHRIHILLAEDNEDHAYLVNRAFSDGDLQNDLTIVGDGREAMDFLEDAVSKEDKNGDPMLPGLVLLDVNMPRMDGFETLEAIKSDQRFQHIPVVMLTSSTREEDVAKSYANGACSYIAKPVKFDEFRDLISNFNMYWSMVAEVPNRKNGN